MTFSISDYPSITISEVDELIDRERKEFADRFEVYRTRNNEVIETFGTENDAINFVYDQDYDRDRVLVRLAARQPRVNDDLNDLESFRNEALRDCPSFQSGRALVRTDLVNASYARSFFLEKNPDTNLSNWPWAAIDWEEAAGNLRGRAALITTYATLGIQRYYDFSAVQ